MAAAGFAAPVQAADFYAGKTIDFVVGADVAGGYDIYARAIAKHLPRLIPGNPTVVVKNLPGAGSAKAAAFIYSVAPKDGTAIGALMPGAIIDPLLAGASAQYDPTKLQYLATADSGTRICATLINSKIKTYDDAKANKAVMGASAAGGSTRDYVLMLRKTTGAQLDLVTGYKGTADIGLAMERGEVDGLCGWDWASLKSQKPAWLTDHQVNILVQISLNPDPELTKLGVPQLWKYIAKEDDRKAVELVVSQQVFGRPYIAPPGLPAERLKILRDAFEQVMQDKEFLADADKARISIEPLNGEKVQAVVTKLYATPPAIVAHAKELIQE
jgi:tripartite-type tricarboxylate transporter receptor subunit TctC